MTASLRVGVVGAGGIAAEVVGAVAEVAAVEVTAVASGRPASADAFAARHAIPRAHADVTSLLADADLDLVYIATPHPDHARLAAAALRAGKHVLCEKPLTVTAAAAEQLYAIARDSGRMLVEAFAYRFHPQTGALLDLIREGAIGEVRLIRVAFGFDAGPDADRGRLVRRDLGGGGILDVGCYCTAMSADIVAAATGAAAPEPATVVGSAVVHPAERTDLLAAGVLQYEPRIVALVSCGVDLEQEHAIVVEGTTGSVRVAEPAWREGRRTAGSTIDVITAQGIRQLTVPGGQNLLALEIAGVAELARGPAEGWQRLWPISMANMRTLDRWRAAVGVSHEEDRFDD